MLVVSSFGLKMDVNALNGLLPSFKEVLLLLLLVTVEMIPLEVILGFGANAAVVVAVAARTKIPVLKYFMILLLLIVGGINNVALDD